VFGDIQDFMSLNFSSSSIIPLVVLENGLNNTSTIYDKETSAKVSIDANATFLTYNYSLNIVNKDSTVWKVRLECFNHTNLDSINATIILHNNSTSSEQIEISGGNLNQTNNDHDIGSNATLHLGIMSLVENSPFDTTILNICLRITTANSTVSTLYAIILEFS
jgi:hypothetical protein